MHFWRPENRIYEIAGGAGNLGRFLDKPAIYYLLDEPGTQTTSTESIFVEGRSEPIEITTRSGTLIVAYAVFTGARSSQLWARTSRDTGKTWSVATKLSEEQNVVTGLSLTAIGSRVAATWRRRLDINDTDAVMAAVSEDGGRGPGPKEPLPWIIWLGPLYGPRLHRRECRHGQRRGRREQRLPLFGRQRHLAIQLADPDATLCVRLR